MKPAPRNPLPSSTGPTTIKEVAAEAGVSTASVSRVLAGVNGVTREVRERVVLAAAKLNYQPNRLARGLRVGQRKVIGVIIPDLRNAFFTAVAYGVEGALYRAGYTLQLGNSDGQPEREQAQLSTMRGEGVAGLVFIAGNRPAANYDMLRNWGIPLVAVDRSPGGLEVDLVRSDNRAGMREAVLHLISLGCQEVAIVAGTAGIDVSEERLGGYLDALRNAGVALREELIVHGDFQQEGGYAAMARLLDMPQPPKGVVVANNLMTLGALRAIAERSVRIPEDLALVVFDDMPWASFLRPPLTAVAQSPEELGRVAAQLLLERIGDPSRMVRRVVLPTRLMVRASCGASAPAPAARGAALATSSAGLKPTAVAPAAGSRTKNSRPSSPTPAAR
jgi:LacI family transcriptional regulator